VELAVYTGKICLARIDFDSKSSPVLHNRCRWCKPRKPLNLEKTPFFGEGAKKWAYGRKPTVSFSRFALEPPASSGPKPPYPRSSVS
jgi:hypothetical protein